MKDFLTMALTAFLGGGLGVALISAINERWKFKAQRKAIKEDKAEEKADKTEALEASLTKLEEADKQQDLDVDERFRNMEDQIAALSKAMQLILLDKILNLGQKYIDEEEIDFDDRRRLRAMHDVYHNGLKGNGDADLIMKGVDNLPLKHHAQSEEGSHADQS